MEKVNKKPTKSKKTVKRAGSKIRIKNSTIGKLVVLAAAVILLLFGPNAALISGGIYLMLTALILKDKPAINRIFYGVAAVIMIGFGCPSWLLRVVMYVGFAGLTLLAMKSPVIDPDK